MKQEKAAYKDIDAYIVAQPAEVQERLQQLRETIVKAAPGAEEVISYQMPAFKLQGMLVYFAAWKEHIGFYPVTSGIAAFKKELSPYVVSKGTIQFPLNKRLPLALIARIVKFRVKENMEKAAAKSAAKPKATKQP